MSTVKEHQRIDEPLQVLELAKKYFLEVQKITSQEKFFPLRTIWQFADRLYNYSIDILVNIELAHNIFIETTQDYINKRSAGLKALSLVSTLKVLWANFKFSNSNVSQDMINKHVKELGVLYSKINNWIIAYWAQGQSMIKF